MQLPITEEHLRTVAYRLWEEAGCPAGRADEFWDRARQELGVSEIPNDRQAIELSEDFDVRGS